MTCHLGASQVLCSAAAESARNLEAPGQFIRLRALIFPQHKPENLGSYFCQPSCQPDLRKLGFQPERLIFHVALTQAWILFFTLACSAYVGCGAANAFFRVVRSERAETLRKALGSNPSLMLLAWQ